ncbi:DUF1465 family protein [bacterium]|nr:DUF1465 family protein [bacterium]
MPAEIRSLGAARLNKQFDPTFRSTMLLVEKTATYLDGSGRSAYKQLSPRAQLVYATASMRLTTSLLETASWCIAWRGYKDGETRREDLERQMRRVSLKETQIEGTQHLPTELVTLIREAQTLFRNISLLNDGIAAFLAEQERSLKGSL